jgi:hypothetical protein
MRPKRHFGGMDAAPPPIHLPAALDSKGMDLLAHRYRGRC